MSASHKHALFLALSASFGQHATFLAPIVLLPTANPVGLTQRSIYRDETAQRSLHKIRPEICCLCVLHDMGRRDPSDPPASNARVTTAVLSDAGFLTEIEIFSQLSVLEIHHTHQLEGIELCS
jgi:hypothetical protein